MSVIDDVAPGDIICVRTNAWPWGWLIRLGAWLARKPSTVDHVAIVSHRDLAGITWVLEGRPGGVGWEDIRKYDNPWMISNADQPKTPEQRQQICALAKAMVGTAYDWPAIVSDAMDTLHIRDLWATKDYGDQPPGHVVCSSYAAWLYRRVGLTEPAARVRWVEPCDWAQFMIKEAWG